jgi:hypothetical protein
MLTEGWTNFLLLGSLFYIVYLQYQIKEQQETIESFNELLMQMAEELTELGSPNVTWSKVNAEG